MLQLILHALKMAEKTYKDHKISLEITFQPNGTGWVTKRTWDPAAKSVETIFRNETVFTFGNQQGVFDGLAKLATDNEALYGPYPLPADWLKT